MGNIKGFISGQKFPLGCLISSRHTIDDDKIRQSAREEYNVNYFVFSWQVMLNKKKSTSNENTIPFLINNKHLRKNILYYVEYPKLYLANRNIQHIRTHFPQVFLPTNDMWQSKSKLKLVHTYLRTDLPKKNITFDDSSIGRLPANDGLIINCNSTCLRETSFIWYGDTLGVTKWPTNLTNLL